MQLISISTVFVQIFQIREKIQKGIRKPSIDSSIHNLESLKHQTYLLSFLTTAFYLSNVDERFPFNLSRHFQQRKRLIKQQ